MKIGSDLTLELKKADKEAEKFKCKIIDKNENEIIVDYPIHTVTKKTEFFSLGSVFLASYLAADNAVYEFPTKMRRRVKLNVPGIALEIPEKEKVNRIQRRKFVRVEATIDVAIHSKNQKFKPVTAITSNISGGGLSIIVSDSSPFALGDILDIWMVLGLHSGEIHYIYSTVQVVFIQSKNNLKKISVKFLSLKPQEQQKIIRYCFEKQREARKKELS